MFLSADASWTGYFNLMRRMGSIRTFREILSVTKHADEGGFMNSNSIILAALLLGAVIGSYAEPYSAPQQGSVPGVKIVAPGSGNVEPAASLQIFDAEHSATASANIANIAAGSELRLQTAPTHKINAPAYLSQDYKGRSGSK
jgi:hypothetical protein